MVYTNRDRVVAVAWGVLTHGLFLLGVAAMVANLHQGLRLGVGPFRGWASAAANLALMLQFPLAHSLLLSRHGRGILARLAPKRLARDLSTTTFAMIASIQLMLTFVLWSPSGVVWWAPTGAALVVHSVVFAFAWIVLGKALMDAGMALQTGALGWISVARGRAPRFGSFPTHGLFRLIRQPVYVAFALTLWTGPVWTPDRMALALAWTAYCVAAPRMKERRMARRHGKAFDDYRRDVPYMLPGRAAVSSASAVEAGA